jgi:hypothetical protein
MSEQSQADMKKERAKAIESLKAEEVKAKK